MGATRRGKDGRAWAEAAYLAAMGTVALCSLFAAMAADGRTPDGLKVWVLATASGYATLYRWHRSAALRAALRGSRLAHRWPDCLALAVTAVVGAAIVFPIFATPRLDRSGRVGQTPSACLTYAFQRLMEDTPDGRMPEMRTQREARERVAPYLDTYVRAFNERREKRGLPPITADYFWQAGEGGRPWIFNPQVSGKSAEELTPETGAPPLLWDEAVRPGRIGEDPCRPVLRVYEVRGRCLNAREWEKIRPRWE